MNMIKRVGVACVLHDINDPRKVLLGLRNKPHKNDGGHGLWVLPGGGLDEGETPNEGVRRELKEEVDCTLDKEPTQLYFDWKNDPDNGNFLMLYYTQMVPRTAVTFTERTKKEFTVLQWYSVDSLPAAMWAEDRAAVERSARYWELP